ncbi:MAG: DUF4339 domain-containing protein [Ferruginibacter sp.]|nr:DUF4339 domain-containing protein [Ferruginibacter sp.]
MNQDDFYSINRLVEFGMTMAVAQQMVESMNHAIKNTHIAGAMNPMHNSAPSFYYAMIENKQAGPFSEQELSRLISEKKIGKETFIWKPGLPQWELAEKIPDVLRLVALTPPPFHQNT